MSLSPVDEAVRLPLLGDDGRAHATLLLSRLPNTPFALTDQDDPERHPSAPRVRLIEAARYRFRVESLLVVTRIGPAELLSADDASLLTGRITTGDFVGEVELEVVFEGVGRTTCRVDVRPTKIGDESSFQAMLSDLAALSVEALHQGFAPAAGRLGRSSGSSPRLLYQRFAVLHALMSGSELTWAFAHLLAEPHRAWTVESEHRRPGTPVRGSSRLARSVMRPGPRIRTPRGPLPHLPESIAVDRTDETVDTAPNRYIRFVLEQWRALAFDARQAAGTLAGAAAVRGQRQADDVMMKVDALLAHSLFREVGRLTAMPRGNIVLQARDGYRQVHAAAALVEATLGLELEIEPFLVSRRSIALLYEHWTFVRLAQAVAAACGSTSMPDLFEVGEAGLSLVLRSGKRKRLEYETQVDGVHLVVSLAYNETFGAGTRQGSWTRPMRPDATLAVQPKRLAADGQRHYLHFDAKYRLDLSQALSDDPDDSDDERGRSKREDLLKMHAYRDAIRGSAAAYVMYPGGGPVTEFAWAPGELLPGLGAIPIRPDHAARDTNRLEELVRRLLRNVASDSTRYNRALYWHATSYAGPSAQRSTGGSDLLRRPPADTPVMLGYVRTQAQWRWVLDKGLYNIRGGSRRGALAVGSPDLDVPFLILYGETGPKRLPVLMRRTGGWEALDRGALTRTGYPGPRGSAYLIVPVTQVQDAPAWVADLRPDDMPRSGIPRAPFTRTWLELSPDRP